MSAAQAGGHRSAPAGVPRGAIVVVHEIFGLTPHIRSLCDRLGAAGFLAHAPDLFAELNGGFLPYTKEGKERGLAIKNAIGEPGLAQLVTRAVSELQQSGHKVGVIGFCLGGTLAWLASSGAGVACTVGYYSVGVGRHLGVQPHGPVLMHFGRSDPAIQPTEIAALRASHPEVDVREYEAGHAFNRDDDAAYEAKSAAQAWALSLEFLHRHLG